MSGKFATLSFQERPSLGIQLRDLVQTDDQMLCERNLPKTKTIMIICMKNTKRLQRIQTGKLILMLRVRDCSLSHQATQQSLIKIEMSLDVCLNLSCFCYFVVPL